MNCDLCSMRCIAMKGLRAARCPKACAGASSAIQRFSSQFLSVRHVLPNPSQRSAQKSISYYSRIPHRQNCTVPCCVASCTELAASTCPAHSVTDSRFPFQDPLVLKDGSSLASSEVVSKLQQFVEAPRMERIRQVVAHRTFNVLPIVEGIYDMGNLSAICRSVDALGIGALHIINTSKHRYKQSARNSAGAEKWLHVKSFESPMECINSAKAAGFQVVVTHLAEDAVDIKDIDWTLPTAIVLGNEKHGVSEEVRRAADSFAILPTHGMVQSLNVSVAAALMLNEARRGREAALGYHADLTDDEQACLRAAMILRHKGRSEQTLSEMLRRPPPTWQESKRWHSERQRQAEVEQREAETVAAKDQL